MSHWLAYPLWRELRVLALTGSGLYDATAAALISSLGSDWPCLEELTVDCNEVGDATAVAIAQAPWPRLWRLSLSGTEQSPRGTVSALGAAALAAAGFARGLRCLDLGYSEISDDGAAALAAGAWPYLQRLGLQSSLPGAAGVGALMRAAPRALPSLEFLDLSHNDIHPAGAAHIADARLPHLEALLLADASLGPEGAEELGRGAAGMPKLKTLNLDGNLIGDAGAAALAAASASWPSLMSLELEFNDLGDEGAAALGAGAWPSLLSLHLRHNELGGAAVVAMARAMRRAFRGMLWVGLQWNDGVDQGSVGALEAIWPDAQVVIEPMIEIPAPGADGGGEEAGGGGGGEEAGVPALP